MASLLSFVSCFSLVLSLAVATINISYPDYQSQSFICAGEIVIFNDGITGQNKQDVLYSTLLAQLAADFLHSRTDIQWFKELEDVMSRVGYVIQSTTDFEQYKTKSKTYPLEQPVKETISSVLNSSMIQLVTDTMTALKALKKDDKQIKLFDSYSKNGTNGGFLVTIGVGSAALSYGEFYFKSKQNGDDIMFYQYNSETTSVFLKHSQAKLNINVYGPNRDSIAKKLGDRVTKEIMVIPLH